MRSIDIHAHLTPQCFWRATEDGGDWHTLRREQDANGRPVLVSGSARGQLPPKASWTPEQRLADMDSLGVDVHVVSPFGGFYNYDMDRDVTVATSRECNDEISQMMQSWPDRFSGLATLPMQDVPAAIAELERVMVNLGFKGAMIDDKINGKLLDEPEFMPFWKAAEQLGRGDPVSPVGRHHRGRAHQALPPAQLGGEPGRPHADLRRAGDGRRHGRLPRPAHLPVPRGRVRLLRRGPHGPGLGAHPESQRVAANPPSQYLSRFYYDCIVYTEESLRFLIDSVGIDRVVFGTDWPYDMAQDWPVSWILAMDTLTQDEKDAILWKNLETLLGI